MRFPADPPGTYDCTYSPENYNCSIATSIKPVKKKMKAEFGFLRAIIIPGEKVWRERY
jgi:hypothetical protein